MLRSFGLSIFPLAELALKAIFQHRREDAGAIKVFSDTISGRAWIKIGSDKFLPTRYWSALEKLVQF
ncbi:MAG: hypothetical protein DI533_22015 [Cereibacter sphaeroides]|uniref:Uncharacterized protein n=1 Tax=Cereibacter sphaeroides TaxID=1063 RepID=A0A2W5S0A1_CERSP|nr:MAG: hypothetical protein DI533_22015 [Cereibacter sphaeroides]